MALGLPSWSERQAKALSGPQSKDTRLGGFYFNLLPPLLPHLSAKCHHPGFGDRELTAPRTAGPLVLRSSPRSSPIGLAHWSWLQTPGPFPETALGTFRASCPT